jgi:hypothetical protein
MGDKTQAFDIFQTPLSSQYPLPLRNVLKSSNYTYIPSALYLFHLFRSYQRNALLFTTLQEYWNKCTPQGRIPLKKGFCPALIDSTVPYRSVLFCWNERQCALFYCCVEAWPTCAATVVTFQALLLLRQIAIFFSLKHQFTLKLPFQIQLPVKIVSQRQRTCYAVLFCPALMDCTVLFRTVLYCSSEWEAMRSLSLLWLFRHCFSFARMPYFLA